MIDGTTSPETVLHISNRYRARAEQVRRDRRSKNIENWDAYRGLQDWSHKTEFQFREVTPSFPLAVEQIVGAFERALTDSDDWLSVDVPGLGTPVFPPDGIKHAIKFYLDRLYQPGNHAETGYGIQVLVSDGVKRGLLEPTVVAKVYPVLSRHRRYRLKQRRPVRDAEGDFPAYDLAGDELESVMVETMRLAIDIIPWDDYLPDPSPKRRFEIHRTRRHLSELRANPEYNQDAIAGLIQAANALQETQDQARSRGERSVGPDPYEVEVFEGWGDVIDEKTGECLHENVFWTWTSNKVLREPTPNPYWDGTRPFVVAPLIRVPGSDEPKALADHAVPMWRATNELVNLLLDGSARAAWGIGQVRADIMESPEDIANGIPQGYTAVLKPNVPQGQTFYERVDNGQAPQLSLEGLNRLEGFLQEALATPDTKLGQLPQRQVKATEIVQAMQASGSLFESFAARFEDTFLEPLFEKCWRLILQYADTFVTSELVAAVGPRLALFLEQLSPAKRFKLLHETRFKVRGLRGLAQQEREFAKLMTLVNLLSSNPQFADHFGQTYDYTKLWDRIIRSSGNDPEMLRLDPETAPDPNDPVAQDIASQPTEPGSAGGQLDPSLAAGTGASQPNVATQAPPEGVQGALSGFAPNNPAMNPAA